MKIIDTHVYVGEYLFGNNVTINDVLMAMDNCQIEQALIIPHKPKGYNLEPANMMVFELAKRNPDRIFAQVRVDPWQGESALNLLKKAHQSYGAKTLLLHPWEEHFNIALPLVDPLVSYAGDNNLIVIIETGYSLMSHPLDVAELAKRFPSVHFVATHGLQLDSSAFALTDATLAMEESPNLIMGTAGMYAFEVLEHIVNKYGEERLIFGSHYPWFNMELEKYRIERLNITNTQKEAVYSKNIIKLINL